MDQSDPTVRKFLDSDDIFAGPDPFRQPSPRALHILIVGGVTGLEWASYGISQRLTLQIFGALWEPPPTQCGGISAVDQDISEGDLKTVQTWALALGSFSIYGRMAANPELSRASGMELARQFSPKAFHWGRDFAGNYGANVNAHGGAMVFLMRLVRSKDLLDQEAHLLRLHRAHAVVNAALVLRVINDGSSFPQIKSSMIVAAKTKTDGTNEDIAFIVPRNDNILVLGSIIREMRQRCEDLLPVLKNARLDPVHPLAQGLRPYRNPRVRLESERRKTCNGSESRIVHCYGHGGAGWSLAFGSSKECVRLVEESVRCTPPARLSSPAN
ncbi:hypothetical protein BDV29DRAFT_189315 [Aspergillus leporis]|uniref:FAD dependent oxidoreductase domain-containing protein n=1 Tax=Aspergillus leporis TaxID=41062 RepID=A0A5N5X8X8_9EURO|nr:hypothetical protein BDV29DRAFT_189315 [Aspergillus leporis]